LSSKASPKLPPMDTVGYGMFLEGQIHQQFMGKMKGVLPDGEMFGVPPQMSPYALTSPRGNSARKRPSTGGGSVVPRTSIVQQAGALPQVDGPRHGRCKAVCNWGLGRQLITVRPSYAEEPPYVTVHYDLRTIAQSLVASGGAAFLAVLCAERLRAQVAGTSIDAALEVTQTCVARDCICCASGKLWPLTLTRPSQVRICPMPAPVLGTGDAHAVLRVVVIHSSEDPTDWRTLGAAVVLKIDMGPMTSKLLDLRTHLQHLAPDSLAEEMELVKVDHQPDGPCRLNGILFQQVVDFYDSIKQDLKQYCASHMLCLEEGRRGHHVCMLNPCPFEAAGTKPDNHRGLPYLPLARFGPSDQTNMVELVPNMQLVIRRYVGTMDHSQVRGREGRILRNTRPGEIGAYVVHCWSSAFEDMVETLQRVLAADDVVLVPGLALCSDSADRVPPVDDPDGLVEIRRMALEAIPRAERMVVIGDQQLGFSKCPHCFKEIFEASKRSSLITYVWPHPKLDINSFKNSAANLELPMPWDEDETAEADQTQDEGSGETAQDIQRNLLRSSGRATDKVADKREQGQGDDNNKSNPVQELREFIQDRAVNYIYAMQATTEEPFLRHERLLLHYEEQERLVAQKEVRRRHLRGECKLEDEIRENTRYMSTLQKNLEQERESRSKTSKILFQSRADTKKIDQESKTSVQGLSEKAERLEIQLKLVQGKLSRLQGLKSGMDRDKDSLLAEVKEERARAEAGVERRKVEEQRIAHLQQKLEAGRAQREEQQRLCRELKEQQMEVDRHCASIEAHTEELRRKLKSSRLERRSERSAD